jgi:seryl-tRNA synthetase
MLPLKLILEQPEWVVERLKIKNFDANDLIPKIISLDKQRKSIQQQLDGLLAELNRISKEIGKLYQQGKTSEANRAKERTAELKDQSRLMKEQHNRLENELKTQLILLPNIPNESVPPGHSSEENQEIRG